MLKPNQYQQTFLALKSLQEQALRSTYQRQITLNKEINYANQLLLNTLPQYVIDRLKQKIFPISDQIPECTVVTVNISFDEAAEQEDTLVAMGDIYCVSQYYNTF